MSLEYQLRREAGQNCCWYILFKVFVFPGNVNVLWQVIVVERDCCSPIFFISNIHWKNGERLYHLLSYTWKYRLVGRKSDTVLYKLLMVSLQIISKWISKSVCGLNWFSFSFPTSTALLIPSEICFCNFECLKLVSS